MWMKQSFVKNFGNGHSWSLVVPTENVPDYMYENIVNNYNYKMSYFTWKMLQ